MKSGEAAYRTFEGAAEAPATGRRGRRTAVLTAVATGLACVALALACWDSVGPAVTRFGLQLLNVANPHLPFGDKSREVHYYGSDAKYKEKLSGLAGGKLHHYDPTKHAITVCADGDRIEGDGCSCESTKDGKAGKYCIGSKMLPVCSSTDGSALSDVACACPNGHKTRAKACKAKDTCKLALHGALGTCTPPPACGEAKLVADEGKCTCKDLADGKKGQYCIEKAFLPLCPSTDNSKFNDKACACPSKDKSKAKACKAKDKCKAGTDTANPDAVGTCTAPPSCGEGIAITADGHCTCKDAADGKKDKYCFEKEFLTVCDVTDDSKVNAKPCACPSFDKSKAAKCTENQLCKVGKDKWTSSGSGFCAGASIWAGGFDKGSEADCRRECDEAGDCSHYCYGTTASGQWSCLRYKSCPEHGSTLKGSDVSGYKCFAKNAKTTAGTCTTPPTCGEGLKITGDGKCTCKDITDGKKDKYCISKAVLPLCAKTDGSAMSDAACACPSSDKSKAAACKKKDVCKIGKDASTAGTCTAPPACADGAKIAADGKCTCKDVADGTKDTYCFLQRLLPLCPNTDGSKLNEAACACPSSDKSKAAACQAKDKCKYGTNSTTVGSCNAPPACADGAKITAKGECTCKNLLDGGVDLYCIGKTLLPHCWKKDGSAAETKACACGSKDGSKATACKVGQECTAGADNATPGTCK